MIKSLFIILIFSASFVGAEPFDWSSCKEEISAWCPDEKDDEKIYSCLHSHDGELSNSCSKKAETPYEIKTNKHP